MNALGLPLYSGCAAPIGNLINGYAVYHVSSTSDLIITGGDEVACPPAPDGTPGEWVFDDLVINGAVIPGNNIHGKILTPQGAYTQFPYPNAVMGGLTSGCACCRYQTDGTIIAPDDGLTSW